MSRLEEVLARAVSDLDDAGARFALVGGLAVSARTEPRFTRDADLAVSTSEDAEAEALVVGLRRRGYAALMSVEQEASGRLATVRLQPPATAAPSGVVLDLLFASSGIEPEIVAASEVLPVTDELRLPVARTGHLIAVKLLAEDEHLRAQDRVDLLALMASADETEVERARRGVELISERGYDRGRDLNAALARLVAGG